MSKNLSRESKLLSSPSVENARSLCAPIVQSTTYVQAEIGQTGVHAYSRCSNPTVDVLEAKLGELEDAPPAVCCSTGLAAETVLFLATLRAGNHVICARGVYGGTTRLLQQIFAGLGIEYSIVDATCLESVQAALRESTRLIFLETPANPTLELTDLQLVCDWARSEGVLSAVDNTFLTALGQQPLELGADISVYSTTKLIDGHSAALGGALVARDSKLLERFRFIRKSIGCIQTPFGAWQTLQGLKTLSIRLQQQSENAATIAQWLAENEWVTTVNYPGLKSFAQRALACRQHLRGHGNVLSFELSGGYAAARACVTRLQLCRLVEHVGSVETLVTHSASMTHADVPAQQRRAAGISDGLLRLSVGLEEPQDVINDLRSAIESVHQQPCGRQPERAHVNGKERVACTVTN